MLNKENKEVNKSNNNNKKPLEEIKIRFFIAILVRSQNRLFMRLICLEKIKIYSLRIDVSFFKTLEKIHNLTTHSSVIELNQLMKKWDNLLIMRVILNSFSINVKGKIMNESVN